MSLLGNARKRLVETVDRHGAAISGGIDKAAAAADRKTGGRHSDKIAGATGRAKEALNRLDGKNDGTR